MKVFQRETRLRTAGGLHGDATSPRRSTRRSRESGVTEGIACIYSPHTTCCVRVNEFETGFLEDFAQLLRKLVPSESLLRPRRLGPAHREHLPRGHGQGNGHSHCMAMLLGTAGESVPVRDGELQLGTWQRVLFIELDRERDRRWLVQVVGN